MHQSYKSSYVLNGFVGYQFDLPVSLTVGHHNFFKFQNIRGKQTNLKGYGFYHGANLFWSYQSAQFELGTGLLHWTMRARALGQTVGNESGKSPYVSFTLRGHLPVRMIIGANYVRYQDVAGVNIQSFSTFFGYRHDL